MAQENPADFDYTIMGYSEEMMQSLLRRTAETNAAHLLPHLRPGLRVLDVGSGPGNITVGLAETVAPGIVYGIDTEQSQVELAQAVTASLQQENATFQIGDATSLPFEDGFFDAVHCHDVLMHIPDTRAVLAEAMRVLKPGGVISCREMITSSSFTHPDFGVIGKAWEMFGDLIATDGGHPEMGKDLKVHLRDAGFTGARISGAFEVYSTPEEIDFIYGVALNWFLSQEMTEIALEYGASTVELAQAIRVAYARWKDEPGALCALAFGTAVAWKP